MRGTSPLGLRPAPDGSRRPTWRSAVADAEDPRLATIGVTMAASAQGRGYAGEAITWLLDYQFLERHKHRVTADCDTRNSNALALLDHLRTRREGHHLQSAWWKG
jgi:RimJ/RimL family protein N-acetyltransferase